MLLDFLLFPLFVALCFALGVGLLAGRRAETVGEYPISFHLVAPFLLLGFWAVAMNFISGVATPVFYALPAVFLARGLWRLRTGGFAALKGPLLLALLLTPLAAGMSPGSDAGLYHLPHQLWIREEKIAFGLANVATRFGFSSFLEYVNATLWVGEHFKLLAYGCATLLLAFLWFLVELARSDKARVAPLGWLTAFGVLLYSGYLPFGFAQTDSGPGLMFAMAFLWGLKLLLDDAPATQRAVSMLFWLGLFALLGKASAALIGLWILFVLAVLMQRRQLTLHSVVSAAWLPTLMLGMWLARSVIVSGCLFYPMVSSCLDVAWNAKSSAIENMMGVTAWARHPRTDVYSLYTWQWITAWWLGEYKWFLLAMAACAALTCGAYGLLQCEQRNYLPRVMLPAFGFLWLCIAVWFVKAPTPRFGVGHFLVFAPVVVLTCYGFAGLSLAQWQKLWRSRIVQRIAGFLPNRMQHIPERCAALNAPTALALLGMLCVVLVTVKLGMTMSIRTLKREGLHFQTMQVPTAEVLQNPRFGVRPAPPSDQCWLVPYCSPDGEAIESARGSYRQFNRQEKIE